MLLYAVAAWVHMWRAFNPGQQLATVNLALNLSPPGRTTQYLATYRTVGNWVQAIAPGLAGLLATTLQETGWSEHMSLALLFVLSGIGRFASLVATRYISEARASSVPHMLAAVRRIPGFSPKWGLAAAVRFWGGPFWSGFVFVRTRFGSMVCPVARRSIHG